MFHRTRYTRQYVKQLVRAPIAASCTIDNICTEDMHTLSMLVLRPLRCLKLLSPDRIFQVLPPMKMWPGHFHCILVEIFCTHYYKLARLWVAWLRLLALINCTWGVSLTRQWNPLHYLWKNTPYSLRLELYHGLQFRLNVTYSVGM